jgi:hypothetical protein
MVTVNFIQDTYELYDEQNILLFGDNKHRYLFDYLRADLAQIEIMLEHFFSEQFDFNLMRLKEGRPELAFREDDYERDLQTNFIINRWDYVIDNAHLIGIVDCLKKSHPYFMIDSNALECAEATLVDYFNSKAYCSEVALHEKEYVDIFEELLTLPPFPSIDIRISPNKPNEIKGFILKHYSEYFSTYDKYGDIRRVLRKGKKIEPPSLKIIEEQRLINKRLLHLLCVSGNAKDKQNSEKVSFEIDMNIEVFIEGNNTREKFNLNNLSQLLRYEVYQMVKAGVKIKACNCCNAFFITKDMKKNYCDRVISGDKTCRDVGSDRFFRRQKKDDPMYQAYRKAFSKNKVRQDRGRIDEQQFNFWRDKAIEKRKNKSEDYNEWLGLSINDIREVYAKETGICDSDK